MLGLPPETEQMLLHGCACLGIGILGIDVTGYKGKAQGDEYQTQNNRGEP